jgi:glutamate/aspartate transport system substrate-binding protein
MILREVLATNHIDFIHQPRPEERAPEHLSKDARVSKDGHKRDRACGHPSRRPREERGLLRMRSEGLISAVRCNWFHGIDRLVASAFRIGVVIAAAAIGATSGHAQVETNDPGIVSGTLARIKTTGTVRLGYRDASIPFSYLDRSGRPIGYSIDICNAIVEEIGRLLDREDLKVDFVKVTSETRLQAIVNDTIDLECGSTTNNLERRKLVDFSPMIFVSGTKLMVPVGTAWRDFRDLKGRKVVVTRGTTNAQALAALDQKFKLGIALLESSDHEESYRMLADGEADAFATDDILLYGLIAQHRSQGRFKVVGEFLSYDPYGIAFRRDEPDLHASVERAVRNLVIARDIDAIYAKWFESRLPNGERFNIPMSPQLEESFKVLGEGSEPN